MTPRFRWRRLASEPNPVRRRLLGPGFLVAIVVAIAIAGQGNGAGPKLSAIKSPPPPPLWKPEPELLLLNPNLRLDKAQRTAIELIDRRWRAERQDLRTAMEPFQQAPSSTAVANIQRSLEDYSQLSRAYDARRATAWSEGLAVLSPEQRKAAEQPGGRR